MPPGRHFLISVTVRHLTTLEKTDLLTEQTSSADEAHVI